ncbi:hypothetical protein ABW21_db0207479 [Orbilia brochopaga]|nr:hypothetical protein ABW21_db0207479 [Drechslerella brochopaga]
MAEGEAHALRTKTIITIPSCPAPKRIRVTVTETVKETVVSTFTESVPGPASQIKPSKPNKHVARALDPGRTTSSIPTSPVVCRTTVRTITIQLPGSAVMQPPPSKSGVGLKRGNCYGLGNNRYLNPDIIRKHIEQDFCPQLEYQTRYGEFWMESFGQTLNEVELSVIWGTGKRPDKQACIKHLRQKIIDGCDNNWHDNPLSWKGGGRTEGDGAQWIIRPRTNRVPARRERIAECTYIKTTREGPFTFQMAGYGFLDSDNGIALYREIKSECQLDIEGWQFTYRSGVNRNNTMEWLAEYKSKMDRINCATKAMRTVSGLRGLSCEEKVNVAG